MRVVTVQTLQRTYSVYHQKNESLSFPFGRTPCWQQELKAVIQEEEFFGELLQTGFALEEAGWTVAESGAAGQSHSEAAEAGSQAQALLAV